MTVGCTTGQLAKAVGVNIQTVQYYEAQAACSVCAPTVWVPDL